MAGLGVSFRSVSFRLAGLGLVSFRLPLQTCSGSVSDTVIQCALTLGTTHLPQARLSLCGY